jgi:hypothetical protein
LRTKCTGPKKIWSEIKAFCQSFFLHGLFSLIILANSLLLKLVILAMHLAATTCSCVVPAPPAPRFSPAWDGVYELVCSSHMLPVICPPGLEKAVLQWLCMVGTCTCSCSSLSLDELFLYENIFA